MRVQSINQNNCRNNPPKKDIGFKMNTCIELIGLKSDFSELKGTTLTTLQGTIQGVLRKFNRMRPGETLTVLQDPKNPAKFWVLDADTIAKAEKINTNTGGKPYGIENPSGVKTYLINWNKIKQSLPN